MKWLAFLLAALTVPAICFAQTAPSPEDAALSQLVESVLHDLGTLRPGMPRSALTTLLMEDGGLQSFRQTRYDFRRCRYIKIDVKFKPATKANNEPIREERDDDVIVEISKPYLQYPFYD